MSTENTEFQGEMDVNDKNALLQCRTKIIKDLDIRIVIDSLLESRVVDESLYEKIKKEVSTVLFHVFHWKNWKVKTLNFPGKVKK